VGGGGGGKIGEKILKISGKKKFFAREVSLI